jgi:hypothetical protein
MRFAFMAKFELPMKAAIAKEFKDSVRVGIRRWHYIWAREMLHNACELQDVE